MDARLTLQNEQVATEAKHWVRLTAACNSRCVFCLDAEAQDGRFMDWGHITTEIRRGREDKAATRLVLSGGEATIHPRFHDAVRFGKEVGYRWVQVVTNGQKLADRAFYLEAVAAGLDEITFSLHGPDAELHDRLTGTKRGFENLMKAMMRAARDERVVVNVDICINRQNVDRLEAIVALCARVGVREFDLLHVIPQGEAFAHRAELFYDPAEHAESLRRVFRLARRPGFHIWTNRFPVAQLEGLEELIQDPHKMLDEVGGRRTQFRRYLDEGQPIECRDPERCPHCFIEPFCSALDRHLREREDADVWWIGERAELAGLHPARWTGLARPLPLPGPWYARFEDFRGVELPPGSLAVLTRPEHLDQVGGTEALVEVDAAIAARLLREGTRPSWILAPREHLHAESAATDPDWKALFSALPGARAARLPACLAPGARLERAPRLLDAALFHEDGRLGIDAFVDHYVRAEYKAKSLRCRACPADAGCAGASIQWLRVRGFAELQPFPGAVGVERPSPRLAEGSPPVPPARRIPVPGNPPVPFVDTAPGRRS